MSELRLIVGLGNPEKNYEYTRHNLGFLIAGKIAEQDQLKLRSSAICKGLEAKARIDDLEYCLLLPLTYMNNSGVAVKRMMEKRDIAPENILIVCDDFNLELGQLRLKRMGSDGGHNGLSSIIYHLGSEDFTRLRVGIGSPKRGQDPADFVLEEFSKKEKSQLDDYVLDAADCCRAWLKDDVEQVMSQFNKRKSNE